MATQVEEEEKAAAASANSVSVRKDRKWVPLFCRVLAFLASASAAVVMGLNKESKDFVVATTGTVPVTVTLHAKFQHTPAFIFFVVANAMASLHSLLMIIVDVFGEKLGYQILRFAMIAILDMMTVGLAAAGDGGAAFMAELGKNGNKHARWNKICDNFPTFCAHGGGALISSFVGLLFLLLSATFSILNLIRLRPDPNPPLSS